MIGIGQVHKSYNHEKALISKKMFRTEVGKWLKENLLIFFNLKLSFFLTVSWSYSWSRTCFLSFFLTFLFSFINNHLWQTVFYKKQIIKFVFVHRNMRVKGKDEENFRVTDLLSLSLLLRPPRFRPVRLFFFLVGPRELKKSGLYQREESRKKCAFLIGQVFQNKSIYITQKLGVAGTCKSIYLTSSLTPQLGSVTKNLSWELLDFYTPN